MLFERCFFYVCAKFSSHLVLGYFNPQKVASGSELRRISFCRLYVFEGLIRIPERGVWEFFTRSDDGSVLLIDGCKVVDNDSSHAAVTATGRVALEAGLHACKLLYFEDYEGQELQWGWKAHGEEAFSPIPD